MAKKIDVPDKIEDYTAPWEKGDGEIDAEKAKHLIFTVLHQASNFEDAAEQNKLRLTAAEEGRATAETKVATLQRRIDAGSPDDGEETKRLKAEKAELQKQIDDFDVKKDPAYIRLQVANEKGLDSFEASRLVGNTREEMEEDADLFLERRPKKTDDESDENDEEQGGDAGDLRTGPAATRGKPHLKGGAKGSDEWSEAELAGIAGAGGFQLSVK